MMHDNLVGYLLRILDPEEEREVEEFLRKHPESQSHVDLLSRALVPLAADRTDAEPPAALRVRTLARVAEYRCSAPLRLPAAPPIRSYAPRRSWWRRADVLVAASILILVVPFIPPGIFYIQQLNNRIACQNNLRKFHHALLTYGSLNEGKLPMVEEKSPRNFAGVFVPVLHDSGVLDSDLSVACPANGRRPPEEISMAALAERAASSPAEFEELKKMMACCYAYSLGYVKNGRLQGIRQGSESDLLPIMADRPPFDQRSGSEVALGNSRNHRGRGQNVLHLGGDVHFRTTRNVGINGDDIYLNKHNEPYAGDDETDAVLGASSFRPRPTDGRE